MRQATREQHCCCCSRTFRHGTGARSAAHMQFMYKFIGRRFAAALLPRLFGRIPGHTTRAPQVGFELDHCQLGHILVDEQNYYSCTDE